MKKHTFCFIFLVTTVFCLAQEEKQVREYYDVNRVATVKEVSQTHNVGKDEIKTVKTYQANFFIQISHLKNGKKEGVQLEYYKNGKLKDRTTWKNGNRIGERTTYHPNGNLSGLYYYNGYEVIETKAFYTNQMEEGTCRTFYENGQPHEIYSAAKGIVYGLNQVFFPDGKLYREGYFLDDQQIGEWVYFNELGEKTIGGYKNGSRSGIWTQYYKNGKIKTIKEFDGNNCCEPIAGSIINFNEKGKRIKNEKK
ncbi:toxin-antitoxin system YwqK family antitoxin [Chryseobacterium chendengshani]|uniref:toxin-antitoxin system YwqK family antitoxin n=1 Tax=Chryseobacterium sp. LJ756 TaxID=2864113 RepID=UPI001C63CEA6|nr:hypothetical protein [Chryseobacterium sp. LJ756]MBW7674052.1 hypothetical protein [Chryseobacterium sp. LJ756]